jgi:hypothetical protein
LGWCRTLLRRLEVSWHQKLTGIAALDVLPKINRIQVISKKSTEYKFKLLWQTLYLLSGVYRFKSSGLRA